jgi:hypothetical protein
MTYHLRSRVSFFAIKVDIDNFLHKINLQDMGVLSLCNAWNYNTIFSACQHLFEKFFIFFNLANQHLCFSLEISHFLVKSQIGVNDFFVGQI